MYRVLLLRFRRRSAVSTMIGGIIVLSLLLTSLGTMVFVSQQYDSYQGTVNKMSQKDINRFSENLGGNGGNTGAVYPGLSYLGAAPGTGCGGTCSQYNMTISNLAGIGTQIARIYVNSTSGGCAPPGGCIADPVSSAGNCLKNCFRMSDRFVNPGEFSHGVLIWLAQQLPSSGYGLNTVTMATTRGRAFSFQWPFPPVGQAVPSGVAISTGVMKIAYTGTPPAYDSKNEPGAPGSGYCHNEGTQPIVAGSLGKLYFVNPWVTSTIFASAFPSTQNGNQTTMYISGVFTNPKSSPITITSGSLIIQTAFATANAKVFFIGGGLVGVYYGGVFYGPGGQSGSPNVLPNTSVTLIFRMFAWLTGSNMAGVSFTGTASVSNGLEDVNYFGGAIVLDGLFVRGSC